MDWADRLVAKKKKRGVNHITAESLRKEVATICESNIERWQGEREYRGETPWNAEELEAERKKETNRLAKLRRDEDRREQLEYDYKLKGIEINADYSQYGKIASVRLPFTSEEWADLLNKEGEYLGVCCADISRIRGILQEACREDHFIDVEDFYEAVFLAKHHGWDEEKGDPIARMIRLWEEVEGDARSRTIDHSANVDDPKGALEILYSAAGTICWDDIYSREGESKDSAFDRHMNRNYALATIRAAVRTLFFRLKEADYQGDIEGYGLVREDGEIGMTSRGLAVYRTAEFAQQICDRWNKAAQEDGKQRKKSRKREPNVYGVKKIRVSMEHGVEILPDDHEIKETPDVTNRPEEPESIIL